MILFLHGFPEFWYSWKQQMREFSSTEWVVALDLPGYGDSEGPVRADAYTVDALVSLVQEFISLLGRDQCVLVGSDYGALIGWHLLQRSPQTFSHFVSISQPLPNIMLDILDKSVHHKLKQWRCYLYQLPWLPEYLIAGGDLDILCAEYGDAQRRGRISPEDMQAYLFAFSRTEDWRGPLSHQRQLFAACNWASPPDRLAVPTLLVSGGRDRSLPVDAMYRCLPHLVDCRIQMVTDAGRHVQVEQPAQVNNLIRDFIGVLPDEPERQLAAADESGPGRSLLGRALEGGQGWLGAGNALYNRTVERINTAAALGERYTRTVMMLQD
ncbi:epoxide hydrolase 4-like [Pollicipes pollicipes]|uniref:epoxide hydrolase 4-like n=1 Tax=Pollicipes pollicipes TaxID=41117 RepID=UPI0018858DB4|nr:epoxide hydrolase 4-like [Pollicipes pollicipes]